MNRPKGPNLFAAHIVGPIHSRRLGVSLGVNLLPTDGKVCSFDCLYCECGWARDHRGGHLPDAEAVLEKLEERLRTMREADQTPDVITFAGNGEPTLHPNFAQAIDGTLRLRDRLCPDARVCVLSNATRIGDPAVRDALMRVDGNILKLDAGTDAMARLIDRPTDPTYSLRRVVEGMKQFGGQLTVQTMFVRGEHDGMIVDNTTPAEVEAWRALVREVAPAEVMVYSLDRPTPERNLLRVPRADLEAIAAPLTAEGFRVQVTG